MTSQGESHTGPSDVFVPCLGLFWCLNPYLVGQKIVNKCQVLFIPLSPLSVIMEITKAQKTLLYSWMEISQTEVN